MKQHQTPSIEKKLCQNAKLHSDFRTTKQNQGSEPRYASLTKQRPIYVEKIILLFKGGPILATQFQWVKKLIENVLWSQIWHSYLGIEQE